MFFIYDAYLLQRLRTIFYYKILSTQNDSRKIVEKIPGNGIILGTLHQRYVNSLWRGKNDGIINDIIQFSHYYHTTSYFANCYYWLYFSDSSLVGLRYIRHFINIPLCAVWHDIFAFYTVNIIKKIFALDFHMWSSYNLTF